MTYNFLIAYLLAGQVKDGPVPLLLFALAMAVQVAGLDALLREHFPNLYDGMARHVLAASVHTGWLTGTVIELADATLALWYAFLAGGIIVFAAVYELPQIRSPRQYAFFGAGAFGFSLLILAAEHFAT